MVWPPRIPPGALDAIAARALAFQRRSFLKMLRFSDALRLPLEDDDDPTKPKPLPEATVSRVRSIIDTSADELIDKHLAALPEGCKRSPGHLQMVSLALAAHRSLLHEARASDEYLATSALKVRSVVADALGVVAPPDGTEPFAVPVQWVPNKIALGLTGALWIPSRRASMAARMMTNFEIDLGPGFTLEPIEPEPSRRLTRCFYRELLSLESDEEADLLGPVFTAMHAATWAGVPGFEFDAEESGACTFRFECSE